jgi:hypothetical protein
MHSTEGCVVFRICPEIVTKIKFQPLIRIAFRSIRSQKKNFAKISFGDFVFFLNFTFDYLIVFVTFSDI